jgi:hypothetical protein
VTTGDYSKEERWAKAALMLMAGFVFILLQAIEFPLCKQLGINADGSMLIVTIIGLLPAFAVSRPLCEGLWPRLLKVADENAAARSAATSK